MGQQPASIALADMRQQYLGIQPGCFGVGLDLFADLGQRRGQGGWLVAGRHRLLVSEESGSSEFLSFVVGGQFVQDFVQVAVQDPVEVMGGEPDAVIGDA